MLTKFLTTNAHTLLALGAMGVTGALMGLGVVSAGEGMPVVIAAAGIGTVANVSTSSGSPLTKTPAA